MISRLAILFVSFFFIQLWLSGQPSLLEADFPYESYYQFPINPGQPNYLAGTVGEIRSSHFHTGIDVKTGGKIGLPIYATAEGYVNRIKISEGGYGQALYMAHPNGTYSVYAHLDDFEENLQRYVVDAQYEKESYEIELFPVENQFYYQKGDIIGYSGNTGSSSGPHLHFEIRDKDHKPMDLLQFGFTEVRDRIAPVVQKIAFTTLDEEARVNELWGRYEFNLIKVKNAYRCNIPIELKGRIGVEIYSYDPMDGIPNKNGIIKTVMVIEGDTLFHENKETLTFGRQRNILKHYNYEAYKNGSRRFNKLYLDEGNEHNIYLKTNSGVFFGDQQKITIFTEDSYQNLSITEVEINNNRIIYPPKPRFSSFEIRGNFLHLKSESGVGIKLNDEWKPVSPYYSDGLENFYLWNINKGLPERVFIDGKTLDTDLVVSIPPKQDISYFQEEFETLFYRRSLFDTLHLSFNKAMDSVRNIELFAFKNHQDPIRSNISITLHPEKVYDRETSSVYSVFGKRFNYMGGTWQGDNIQFETRDLVTYTVLTDSVPPAVREIIVTPQRIRLQMSDKLSGISSYRAELNGKFVLMRYEAKKDIIWAVPKEPNIPLKGEFTLEVTDNANNKTIYTTTL